MTFMTVLWVLAMGGLLGGAALLLVSLFVLAVRRYRSLLKPAAGTERRLVWAAVVAAVLGSLTLAFAPAYESTNCSVSVSVTAPSSTGVTYDTQGTACAEQTATFVQVNGPVVILLFTVPILFALVPLFLRRPRYRGLVLGFCALLLAGQAAIGMSGYGLAFAPSSVLLVLAGFVGIFRRSAHQDASADAPYAPPALRGRG